MATEKRLIDVNKVIDAMQKCLDESPDKKDSLAYFAFESIIECLNQEPTVDAVEVVHGHWGEYEVFPLTPSLNGYPCSVCGNHVTATMYNLNYCPNCGAKMDGDNHG